MRSVRPYGRCGTYSRLNSSSNNGCSRLLTTSLVVFARNEPGALLAMTQIVTEHSLAIVDVSTKLPLSGSHWKLGAFQFRVQVANLDELATLKEELANLPICLGVRRDSIQMMVNEVPRGDRGDGFWEFWSRYAAE